MKCPYCAEEIKDEAVICRYCSRNISLTRKCSYCAEEIKDEAVICRYCGYDISRLRENERLLEMIASLQKQVSELAATLDAPQTGSQSIVNEYTTAGPPIYSSDGGVTLKQLQSIMPTLDDTMASQYLPHLNAAMAEADINTALRQAAFLAQLAYESEELLWMEELNDGGDYAAREDLGNIYEGDGRRFKGRGPIQLTGRKNYTLAGEVLGLDLVNNPESAADPDVCFRTAAWYWTRASTAGNLNHLADEGDFGGITFGMNAGWNNYEARIAYYLRAREVLNVQ